MIGAMSAVGFGCRFSTFLEEVDEQITCRARQIAASGEAECFTQGPPEPPMRQKASQSQGWFAPEAPADPSQNQGTPAPSTGAADVPVASASPKDAMPPPLASAVAQDPPATVDTDAPHGGGVHRGCDGTEPRPDGGARRAVDSSSTTSAEPGTETGYHRTSHNVADGGEQHRFGPLELIPCATQEELCNAVAA